MICFVNGDWVADYLVATALHYDLALVTRNVSDFQRIPGLRLLERASFRPLASWVRASMGTVVSPHAFSHAAHGIGREPASASILLSTAQASYPRQPQVMSLPPDHLLLLLLLRLFSPIDPIL